MKFTSAFLLILCTLSLMSTTANCQVQEMANNDAPELHVLDTEDVAFKTLSDEGNSTEGADDYYDDEEVPDTEDGSSFAVFAELGAVEGDEGDQYTNPGYEGADEAYDGYDDDQNDGYDVPVSATGTSGTSGDEYDNGYDYDNGYEYDNVN